ncbi:MAG: hypothetical protein ACOX3T_06300 [Bdellovibrionota bacterium]
MKKINKVSNIFLLFLVAISFLRVNVANATMSTSEAKHTESFGKSDLGSMYLFYTLEKALIDKGIATDLKCKYSSHPNKVPEVAYTAFGLDINNANDKASLEALLNNSTFPYCSSEFIRNMYVGRSVAANDETADEFCKAMGYEAYIVGSGQTSKYSSYGSELVVSFNVNNSKWELLPKAKDNKGTHYITLTCGTTKCMEDDDCEGGQVCKQGECLDVYTCLKDKAGRVVVSKNGVELTKEVKTDKCENNELYIYSCVVDRLIGSKIVISEEKTVCEYGCDNKTTQCYATECDVNYGDTTAGKRACPTISRPICNCDIGQCKACSNNEIYNEAKLKCVECNKDADCKNSAKPFCNLNLCQATCKTDAQCKAKNLSRQVCNNGVCVECVADSDCQGGKVCKNNSCLDKYTCVKDKTGKVSVYKNGVELETEAKKDKCVDDALFIYNCSATTLVGSKIVVNEEKTVCEYGCDTETKECYKTECDANYGDNVVGKRACKVLSSPVCENGNCVACPNSKVYNSAKKSCVECNTNANCKEEARPICLSDNTCGCSVNDDCPSARPVCENKNCVACPSSKVYNSAKKSCVECNTNANCKEEARPICLSDNTCGCNVNDDCPVDNPFCNTAIHQCTNKCVKNVDCKNKDLSKPVCDNGVCVECVADSDCQGEKVCKNNSCLDKYTCAKDDAGKVSVYKNGVELETEAKKDKCVDDALFIYNCSATTLVGSKIVVNEEKTVCEYGCDTETKECYKTECDANYGDNVVGKRACKVLSSPVCENGNCVACPNSKVYNSAKKSCVECNTNANCKEEARPICLSDNTCGCSVNDDCPVANPVCENGSCVACPNSKVYNSAKKSCVECNTNANCKEEARPICLSDNTCGCSVNDDCHADNPFCNTAIHQCTNKCVKNVDCKNKDLSKPVCDNGVCVECVADSDCQGEKVCKNNSCLDKYTCAKDDAGKVSVYKNGLEITVKLDKCENDKQYVYSCESDTQLGSEILVREEMNSCEYGCDSKIKKCNAKECDVSYGDTRAGKRACIATKPVCENGSCKSCKDYEIYNKELLKCVECNVDVDCRDKAKPFCNLNLCQATCKTDTQCKNIDASKPVCDTASGLCVECTSSNQTQCKETKPICLSDNTCGCNVNTDCPVANPFCLDNKVCVNKCSKDADCLGDTPVCDTASGLCVECVKNEDCKEEAKPICLSDNTCGCNDSSVCPEDLQFCSDNKVCVENCTSDEECRAKNETKPVCNDTTGKCEECVTDVDCDGERVCSIDTYTCVECKEDKDCKDGKVCNLDTNTCVECNKDDDCNGNAVCDKDIYKCKDTQKAVLPIFNCVIDNLDGTYTAYFGYENPNAEVIDIQACSKTKGIINTINDTTTFCEQTSKFKVGTVKGAFYIPFNKGQTVLWTLQNSSEAPRVVSATSDAVRCTPLEPYAQCIDKNKDGSYKAHFGYTNKNGFEIEIPNGSANYLSTKENVQPEHFFVGKIDNALSIDFTSSITWNLNGKEATITKKTKPCVEVNCTETSLIKVKHSLHGDEFEAMLETQTESLLKEKKPFPFIRDIEASADRRINRAKKNNDTIKKLALRFPDIMFNCDNADFCPLYDNQEILNSIERRLRKLRRQVGRTVRQRNIDAKIRTKLLNKNAQILASKMDILNSIPRFANDCES